MENTFLCHAFLLGIVITFVYDLLRILRRVFPHGSLLISLEDLLFWIYCGVEVFLLMYHESNGVLRWFAVLGAVLGMVLYGKFVSPVLIKYVSLFLKKVCGLLWKGLRILCTPLRFLMVTIRKKVSALNRKMVLKRRKMSQRGAVILKKKLTYLREVLKM